MAQGGMFNYLTNITYKSIGANKAITDAKRVRKSTAVPWDSKAAQNYEKNARKAFGAFEKGTKPVKGATTGMNDFTKAMRRALIVAPVWMALRTAMMAVVSTIKEGVKFLIDWEYQMAQLRIVGKGTAAEYNALSNSLLRLATTYGVANAQMGEAAKLWIQQGKAISEIPSLMESTIKLSMLSGRTMSQSVEDLTAVMKSYNITAEESSSIIDKVTKTMLSHAITTDTLVSALKLVAPVADQFNVSFEKMLGIITASHVATRMTGSRIGRAWSTIFIRMGTSAKKGIQEIAKVPVYLDKFGKATFNQTTELRNFGDVLDEIALKTATFSSTQKANLANIIAGKRRAIAYTGAMKSWEEGMLTSIDALNAYGEGNKAVNILLETAKIKTQQLGGAWNEYIMSLVGGTAGMKTALGGLTGFIKGLTRVEYYLKGKGFGKLYDNVRATTEEFKKSSDAINGEIQNLNRITGLSKQLISLVETKTRIEKKGGKNSEVELKKYNKYIKLIRETLSKQDGMENLLTMPIDEAVEYIKSKQPEFEDMILSERAKSNILQRNQKLIDEMTIQWDDYLNKKTKYWSFPDLPGQKTAEQASTEELEDLLKKLEKTKPFKVGRGGITAEDVEAYNAAVTSVKRLLKLKSQKSELSGKDLEDEIARLEVGDEIAKTAEISVQQFKEKVKEYKALLKRGYSELDVNKLILDYIEEQAGALETIDADLKRRLKIDMELFKIQEDYNRELDEQSLTLNTMKAQGYTTLQIETQRLVMMKKQKIGQQAIYEQQLKIKKAAIDIYESEKKRFIDLYMQYEKADMFEKERIRRFMELSKMSPTELASAFENDMFDKRIILEYWSSFTDVGKAAIHEVMKELYPDLPTIGKPSRPYDDTGAASAAQQMSFNQPLRPYIDAGMTKAEAAQQRGFNQSSKPYANANNVLSTINMGVNVGDIEVTVPEGSLEKLAQTVGDIVIEKLQTQEELIKLFSTKIRPYI